MDKTYTIAGKEYRIGKITNRVRRDVFALIEDEEGNMKPGMLNKDPDKFNKFYKLVLDGETAGVDFDGEGELSVLSEVQSDFFTALNPRTTDAKD